MLVTYYCEIDKIVKTVNTDLVVFGEYPVIDILGNKVHIKFIQAIRKAD